jgi:branched-chain amino acid transport system permease protein
MERKKQNPIVQWIVKSKILGILFFVIIGVFAVYEIGHALLDNPSLFLQQVVNGLQLGFVYALIALGYTMIYGVVQLINFAHGDVFMVGAFASYYSISRFNLHLWFQNLFPSMPALLAQIIGTITVVLASMIVCAILAFVIERIAYKPLRNAPRISALITAIGISFFLEYFGALNFAFTSNYVTYQRPFEVKSWFVGPSGFGSVEFGVAPPDNSVIFSNIFLIIVFASILLLLVLQYIVKKTKIGKAMRAVAYDKMAAQLMGINSNKIISVTFALGAALAGAAGVLYAIAFPQVYFSMGITPGLKAFVAAVVGGIGSIPGAFIGALIMGQAETLSAAYISTPMRDAIAFSLLIVVLLIRPKGIMGEVASEKV